MRSEPRRRQGVGAVERQARPLGATIDIPIAHKDALYVRATDTMEVTVPDAPFPDEIAVICVMATRGRMNARLGGLTAADAKGVDGLR
jgi:hypothetical protein